MPLHDPQRPIGYVNTATGQAVSEADIRAAFPNTSFPRPLPPPEGYAHLYVSIAPTYDSATHVAELALPAIGEDGNWRQQWIVRPLDAGAS